MGFKNLGQLVRAPELDGNLGSGFTGSQSFILSLPSPAPLVHGVQLPFGGDED